jgi:hypothetical protein
MGWITGGRTGTGGRAGKRPVVGGVRQAECRPQADREGFITIGGVGVIPGPHYIVTSPPLEIPLGTLLF